MRCDNCLQAVPDGATAYRVHVGGGHRRAVCGDCVPQFERYLTRSWCDPRPCRECGRPVVEDRRREPNRVFVCSDACREAAYLRRARELRAWRRKETRCPVCGEVYLPKRRDSRYCSAACRESARQRLRASARRLHEAPDSAKESETNARPRRGRSDREAHRGHHRGRQGQAQ